MLPCLIFEDEHLLVVNKPAGLNTHAPGPFAGEGLYEWLRSREARWESLGLIQRLDKETSGVLVFSKTPLASRSLTEQFTQRTVRKTYLLLTGHALPRKDVAAKTCLVRAGDKYLSRPWHAGGQEAETVFRLQNPAFEFEGNDGKRLSRELSLVEARPRTGRTHQIRVHAAELGFPILGDTLYGGAPAPRVYLHAAEIAFEHPASGQKMRFQAPAEFSTDARQSLRTCLIEPETTGAYRLLHGASDGWPDWYVERLGDYLISQGERPLSAAQLERLRQQGAAVRGVYHKLLSHRVQARSSPEASPQHILGTAAPERFNVRENGLQFELSFSEGYSYGLFLDQRENRRRLLTGRIAPGFPLFETDGRKPEVLNAFAYTCGFSVCAAKSGAHTVSIDLSKKYLEWGKRNFLLNQLDPAGHEFIQGDVLDWLRRLERKGRRFDAVLLDPPSFSRSKVSGVFQAEKHYPGLVAAVLPILKRGGVLFASTNAAAWPPAAFLQAIDAAVQAGGRVLIQRHYVPQPPDFPVSRFEPAYLKTAWLRVG